VRSFFKPTKGKIILTILLSFGALYCIALGLSFFGNGGINRCIADVPGMPTPTPEPFAISRTIHDLTLDEGEYPCLKNDSSAQVAFSLQHAVPVIGCIFLLFLLYVISCTAIFFMAKLKLKKSPQRKTKK